VDVAALAAAVLLAMVFAIAAAAKLADGGADVASLRGLGFPDTLATRLRWGLPVTEMAVALLLACLPTARFGAAVAAGLLVAFTFLLGVSVARGNGQPCSCFGSGSQRPVGWRPTLRNLLLLGSAVAVILHPPGFGSWTQQALVIALVVAVVQAWLLWTPGGRAVRGPNLPTASPASPPGVASPGATVAARQMPGLATAAPVADHLEILVFVDAHCAPCRRLLPVLAAEQRRLGAEVIGVVSSGGAAAAASLEREFGLARVTGQDGASLAERYGVPGTPSAVLVSPHGGSVRVVAGVDAVIALLLTLPSTSNGGKTGDPEPAGRGGDGRAAREPIQVARAGDIMTVRNPASRGTARTAGDATSAGSTSFEGDRADRAPASAPGPASDSEVDVLGRDKQGRPVPAADPGGRWTVVLRIAADPDSQDVVAAAQLLAQSRYRLAVHARGALGSPEPVPLPAHWMTVTEETVKQAGLLAVPSVVLLDPAGRPATVPTLGSAPVLATLTALTRLHPDELEKVPHAATAR
jgi:Methylamine utilisation protein MauE